ncbi:MAG: TspO/MBR family protein [Planctomycetota bacterium]
MRIVLPLMIFVALVAAAAYIGAQFTPGEWYATLHRPPLAPPNWIFGPVWTVLYLCIAIAAFLMWRSPNEKRRLPATMLWCCQLTLNALWSWLFFGLERPGVALIEIMVLLVMCIATMRMFLTIRKSAGLLFLPYVVWVSFATYLNAGFWFLNR